jgi:hypothetical protein
MSFVDFLLQPFRLPKVGARTLAIPKTAVKKFKIDNTNKPYSGARKNTEKNNTLLLKPYNLSTDNEEVMMYFNKNIY